ncbi:MAG: hypothetical protein IKC03_01680 [Oscillospiraceae bacterium]|nr:hypothetical protein [Oscillospiraceae bacterium]
MPKKEKKPKKEKRPKKEKVPRSERKGLKGLKGINLKELKGKKLIIFVAAVLLLVIAVAAVGVLIFFKFKDTNKIVYQLEEDMIDETMYVVPPAYFIGTEMITAIPQEPGVKLNQFVTSKDGAYVYAYSGFRATGESIQAYVEMMTAEEVGFQVVNHETHWPESQPDFTLKEGVVCLSRASQGSERTELPMKDKSFSRNDAGAHDLAEIFEMKETERLSFSDENAENNKITLVQLEWKKRDCIVSVSVDNKPVKEEEKKPNHKGSASIGHTEAVDVLKSLAPASLGLGGESMENYNIYITNGYVYVNDQACLCAKIYGETNSTHTNFYQGTYFLSGDGEHIYQLNENGSVVELDWK